MRGVSFDLRQTQLGRVENRQAKTAPSAGALSFMAFAAVNFA